MAQLNERDVAPFNSNKMKRKTIEQNIKLQGRKMTWLAEQLGMSRRNLYNRFENDNWTFKELDKLKELELI